VTQRWLRLARFGACAGDASTRRKHARASKREMNARYDCHRGLISLSPARALATALPPSPRPVTNFEIRAAMTEIGHLLRTCGCSESPCTSSSHLYGKKFSPTGIHKFQLQENSRNTSRCSTAAGAAFMPLTTPSSPPLVVHLPSTALPGSGQRVKPESGGGDPMLAGARSAFAPDHEF
jgi:hypothetical protein